MRTRFFKPVEQILKLVHTIELPKPGVENASYYVYMLRKQWGDTTL
jgi:hypothetical protein